MSENTPTNTPTQTNSVICELEKKQIEEMAKDLCQNTFCNLEEWHSCKLQVGEYCAECTRMAERLYKAGYRKQSAGEWNDSVSAFCNKCTVCGAIVERYSVKNKGGNLKFCPNCGAKMKGEPHEK